LFGESIQWDVIEKGQQELTQVILSIQAGHLASPTLLRKLRYGGARNHLFAAAHEVGRADATTHN
jgi:TnpA family transposase